MIKAPVEKFSMFENFPHPLLIVDDNLTIVYQNVKCRSLLHQTSFIGQSITTVIRDTAENNIQSQLQTLVKSAAQSKTFTLRLHLAPMPYRANVWALDDYHLGIELTQEGTHLMVAKAIEESAAALAGQRELHEIMQHIMQKIRHVISYDAANLMLLEDGKLRMAHHVGYDVFSDDLTWIKTLQFTLSDSPIWEQSHKHPITIIPDTKDSDSWYTHPSTKWVRSSIITSLWSGNTLLGFLHLDSATPNFYREEYALPIQTFSHHAATAIQNARRYQAEKEQEFFAYIFSDIAENLTNDIDLTSFLQHVLELLSTIFPSISCNVILIDDDNIARLKAFHGYEYLDTNQIFEKAQFDVLTEPDYRKAIETQRPLYIPDTRKWDNWKSVPQGTDSILSHIKAPIVVHDEVVGFICIDSLEINAFNSVDIERLEAFTKQSALAIRNARLLESEHQQRRFAEALIDINIALNSMLDPEKILDYLLEAVERIVPHDGSAILLVEPDGTLRPVANKGYTIKGKTEWEKNFALSVNALASFRDSYRLGVATVIPDVRQFEGWISYQALDWIRSHINAPIQIDGEVVGFVCLDSRHQHYFRQEHVDKLKIFTQQVALWTYQLDLK